MNKNITPTTKERVMKSDEFIVSKTDTKGRLTYFNRIFIEYSGYDEAFLSGKQHNVVRHPEMPRSVFNMLWATVKSGEEFIGYVKNMAADGSFYWVHATVTPSYEDERIVGFFSIRRKPDIRTITVIDGLYKKMLNAERQVGSREAIGAGTKVLMDVVNKTGKSYHEFIISL